MEVSHDLKSEICVGCLAYGDAVHVQDYKVKGDLLRRALQVSELCLCGRCKHLAVIVEQFLQNVRLAQVHLRTLSTVSDSELNCSLDRAKKQLCSVLQLEHSGVVSLELKESEPLDRERWGVVKVPLKLEVKHELSCEDREPAQDDDFPASPEPLKEESKLIEDVLLGHDQSQALEVRECEDAELKTLAVTLKRKVRDETKGAKVRGLRTKREPLAGEEDKDSGRNTMQELKAGDEELQTFAMHRVCVKRKMAKVKCVRSERCESVAGKIDKAMAKRVETIYLSREECLEQRRQQALSKPYASAPYKCQRCVKPFSFRETFDRHMLKHKESEGPAACDVCGARLASEEQLVAHRLYHFRRYRCSACGLTRACRVTIAEHYAASHAPHVTFQCAQCPAAFRKKTLLKKHTAYHHGQRRRVACQLCHKTYVNQDVLRTHLWLKHGQETQAPPVRREHACAQCGAGFLTPSHLRAHAAKHSDARDFYCVECDRHFKTAAILRQHLRTAAPHAAYVALPLVCSHCEKRFAIRRDLERHVNRVHLNAKPYQCDQCDKAYTSPWSLQEHKKLAHEGYRRPLKFACPMCDKVFDRNVILKSHIRTHTGERPYQCAECPARFAQSGVLHTHTRLIHRKLQRNGQPRQPSAPPPVGSAPPALP